MGSSDASIACSAWPLAAAPGKARCTSMVLANPSPGAIVPLLLE